MTPGTLAKSDTEHGHQRAFFQWLNMAARYGFEAARDDLCYEVTGYALKKYGCSEFTPKVYPELNLFHAIPNGGQRGDGTAKGRRIAGAKMKQEGVKPGVCDTFLPVAKSFSTSTLGKPRQMYMYHGLYIEMKAPEYKTRKNGGLSGHQDHFIEAVRCQGYCARVAYSWREAANLVMMYYGDTLRIDT